MLVLATFIINAGFNFALGLLVAHFLGPADFGLYAFAQAIGVLLNTTLIDWVKLSTTRFYSDRTRQERPGLRRTLDTGFIVSSLAACAVSTVCLVGGVNFGLSTALASLVPVIGISYALFDYHTAMTRSLFNDRLYATIVVGKNLFSLALMVGSAWYFHDPVMVLAGLCLSQVLAWLSVRRSLREPGVAAPARRSIAKSLLLYALPIVAANGLYQIVPLYNRAAIASALGVAEMGQYSLAFDLCIRLFSTIGSAFDMLLFQLAVRSHHEEGLPAARQRLAGNLGILISIILPLALGLWLVLDSIEASFVPAQFRGAFAQYATQLIPGLACLSLVLYGLNPVLQIRNRTYPIILACLAAVLAHVLLVHSLPPGSSGVAFARAQTEAMFVALGVTLAFVMAIMPVLPRPRALMSCGTGLAAMSLMLWPLRALPPGVTTLALSAGLGAGVYLGVQYLFNAGDLRTVLASRRSAEAPH